VARDESHRVVLEDYLGTDTMDFIGELNALVGFSTWRLPDRKELRSIVDHDKTDLTINSDYFPNTPVANYWTSSTYNNMNYSAWYVYFFYGADFSSGKSNLYHVRAVSGPKSREKLIDNGNGTVTDLSTGLMWQQATAPGSHSWQNALSYCEDLSLGGYTDWRLPTIKELDSIVDLKQQLPAIDIDYFPDTDSNEFYWTSTTYQRNAEYGYRIYFDYGGDGFFNKTDGGRVRAVRGGQVHASGLMVITAPMQADLFLTGQAVTITWDPAGIAGNVGIFLSRDGGITFETIAESTPNDGGFLWTATGPSSCNCVLKIEPIAGPGNTWVQGLFSIFGTGDINFDLAVDLTDVILLLQITTGIAVDGIQLEADVDGNGTLGLQDAIWTIQTVSGLRP